MPHGHPDWGEAGIVSTIFKVMDLGELAARLGSIDTFDRRGNVIFLDGFECGLSAWQLVLSGTGAAVYLTSQEVRNGSYAVRLVPGTDGDKSAGISRRLPYPATSKVGLEASIRLNDAIRVIDLALIFRDGSHSYSYWVRYNGQYNRCSYLNESNVFIEFISSLDLVTMDGLFHTFKLVIDMNTKKYVRFIINETVYPMTEFSPPQAVDTGAPYIDAVVFAEQIAAVSTYVLVDDIIITQNEA